MAFLLMGKLRRNNTYNLIRVIKPVKEESDFKLMQEVQLEFLLHNQKINPLSHSKDMLGKYQHTQGK